MTERMAFEFTGEVRHPKKGEWYLYRNGSGPILSRGDSLDDGHFRILIPHPIPESDTVPVKVETLREIGRDAMAHNAPGVAMKVRRLIPALSLREAIESCKTHGWYAEGLLSEDKVFDILRKRGIDLEARE